MGLLPWLIETCVTLKEQRLQHNCVGWGKDNIGGSQSGLYCAGDIVETANVCTTGVWEVNGEAQGEWVMKHIAKNGEPNAVSLGDVSDSHKGVWLRWVGSGS